MKKLLIFSLLLMISVACSKDEETKQPEEKLPSTKEQLKELLTQKWAVEDNADYKTFYFFEDGTYRVIKNNNEAITGSYQIESDLKTIILSEFASISLSALSNMEISFNIGNTLVKCIKESIHTEEKLYYRYRDTIFVSNSEGGNGTPVVVVENLIDFAVYPKLFRILVTTGDEHLYGMDLNGKNINLIDAVEDVSNAIYTPDGSKIICTSAYDLYVLENGNTRKLTNFDDERMMSAGKTGSDGKIILYERWDYKNEKTFISRINIDGSNPTDILYKDSYRSFDISSDGRSIAYVKIPSQIAISDIDGTNERIVYTTKDGYIIYDLSWNYDAKKIVFTQAKDLNFELCIMNNDGSNLKTDETKSEYFQPVLISE